MSKRRLVITLVLAGRSQVARNDGVSQGWVSRLMARLSPARGGRVELILRLLLVCAGAVTPEPAKRPKSSYRQFEADQPNETWQSGVAHYRLSDAAKSGTDVEILTWLDDCSR